MALVQTVDPLCRLVFQARLQHGERHERLGLVGVLLCVAFVAAAQVTQVVRLHSGSLVGVSEHEYASVGRAAS